MTTRGGLLPPRPVTSPRRVYLLQRKAERLGTTLGKTTGWIHRTSLKTRGVVMRGGVTYQRIDDQDADDDNADGCGETHVRFSSAQKALPRNGNMRPKYITHTQHAIAENAIALLANEASSPASTSHGPSNVVR